MAVDSSSTTSRRRPPLPPILSALSLLQSILLISFLLVTAHASIRQPPVFLKDVVKAIAAKERWDPEAEVRVSQLDGVKRAKIGSSQKYDLHVRAASKVWLFGFSDESASWKKLGVGDGGLLMDLLSGVAGLVQRSSLRPFELEGPLKVHGVGDGGLSLLLPMNTTHTGLKRFLVGEGIKIKLEGVQEATFVLPSDLGLLLNKSLLTLKEHRRQFWPHKYPECTPLLSVYIQGPASVSAYRVRNPRASIGTLFHSPDVVDLLPEKRYDSSHFNHHPLFSILSLHSKLNLLDKIFRIILGNKIQNGGPHIVKAKIATSTLVKFWLELERDITPDYRLWKKVAEWKTRPVVERVQFEVVARVEEGRALKPVLFNKLKKPFGVETSAWSNLMSNISFTKIPSLVVPPEPLTLDVKW